ncbi:cyclodeaminase/cyclohydrolase family protein [Acidiplasma cupricumulans]|uniref:cyclodeaminase/cyclohydrolase family protein n=1 Tax=Acidiplasma cupricumulans TaxID=312540 RepID=UPI000780C244|nr:cyclodeaminase/cyclohydrolase family protein [Acidiplasma cupricumulans]
MEIDEYINNLKSDSAAPGGGSASALTSIFSASLNSMASLLSLKKEKLRENYGKYNNIVLQSNKIIDDLKSLMNEDEKNFMDIMDALRISRNDKNRPNKINYAVKKA